MKITEIEIRNRSTLADVKIPLGDVNVIYGRNGTGKTLISELLRAAENMTTLRLGTAKLHFEDGGELSDQDFQGGALSDKIRVFNRHFVDENVFASDPQAITIGSGMQALRERIGEIDAEVETIRRDVNRLTKERDAIQRESEQLKTDRGREIRQGVLPAAQMDGSDERWRNFNKTDVERIIDEIGSDVQSAMRQSERLDSIVETISQQSYPPLLQLAVSPPRTDEWVAEARRLCSIIPVASPLSDASTDAGLSKWLESGLRLMGDSSHCPFCRQIVPEERAHELLAHFTDQRETLDSQIEGLITRISAWSNSNASIVLPKAKELRSNLRRQFEDGISELSLMIDRHHDMTKLLIHSLETKRDHLMSECSIPDFQIAWDAEVPARLNQLIVRHNDSSEIVKVCREFVFAKVAEIKPKLDKVLGDVSRLDDRVQTGQRRIIDLQDEREELMSRLRPAARAARRLNELLADFVGHSELAFSLNPSGDTYSLTRNGCSPDGISDGERNAVGLMYFLMRLKDDGFDPTRGIVVFDDPVTSLDDERLYGAISKILAWAGLSDEIDTRVGQCIVLTHHLGTVDRLRHESRSRNFSPVFFELRSEEADGVRTSRLVKVRKPTTFRYHVAFDEVFRVASGLSHVNNAGNSIRLCLEGFMHSVAPTTLAGAKSMAKKMEYLKVESGVEYPADHIRQICMAANAESHLETIDDPRNAEQDQIKVGDAAGKLRDFMLKIAPMHFRDMEVGRKERMEG